MYTEICAELGVTIAVASSAPYIQFSLILFLFRSSSSHDHSRLQLLWEGTHPCPVRIQSFCVGDSRFSGIADYYPVSTVAEKVTRVITQIHIIST
jgi:hypothetical protein